MASLRHLPRILMRSGSTPPSNKDIAPLEQMSDASEYSTYGTGRGLMIGHMCELLSLYTILLRCKGQGNESSRGVYGMPGGGQTTGELRFCIQHR